MIAPDYVISTCKGCIPHVVNITQNTCFQKHYLVYVDDFLHPDGYYASQSHTCNINTFLQIPYSIIVAFRHSRKPSRRAKTRVLQTFQGNHTVTKAMYEHFIARAKPAMHASFDTSDVGVGLVEPSDLDDACRLLNKGCIIGTLFVNEMTDRGLLIDLDNGARPVHVTKYGFQCSCCAQHGKAYIEHLWSIGEIICMSIIQNHNYRHLQRIVDGIRTKNL